MTKDMLPEFPASARWIVTSNTDIVYLSPYRYNTFATWLLNGSLRELYVVAQVACQLSHHTSTVPTDKEGLGTNVSNAECD
jgi:hypothetical protein